jgi:hypothetical protein
VKQGDHLSEVFEYWSDKKFQITNHKFQTNLNDQNAKFHTGLCVWILQFGISLEFGAWNLTFCNTPPLRDWSATEGVLNKEFFL